MAATLITTVHDGTPARRRLTDAFFRFYNSPPYALGGTMDAVAACSPGSRTDRIADFYLVDAPNDSLCRKWAAALAQVRSVYGADYDPGGKYEGGHLGVIIAGSDDFIHTSWIDCAFDLIDEGYDAVLPRSCYLYDAPTGRACYMTTLRACGAGRVFSRAFLDRCEWNLWSQDEDVAWMPVAAQNRRFQELGITPRTITLDPHDKGLPIVDVKVGDNLNSYDDLLRKTETMQVNPKWLWDQYPQWLKASMFNWNKVPIP